MALAEAPRLRGGQVHAHALRACHGKIRGLTEDLDERVEAFTWAPDSRSLYFTSHVGARGAIFRVGTRGKAGGDLARRIRLGAHRFARRKAARLLVELALAGPGDLERRLDGKGAAPVTHVNDAFWKEVEMGEVSERRRGRPTDGISRPGSSSRRASTPRRSIRRFSSSTAARRAPGPTPGPPGGIRRSGRPTATSSTPPTRAARPASARSSWTRSPATGAERSTTT